MVEVAWDLGLDRRPPDAGNPFVGHRETTAKILERSLGENTAEDPQHRRAAGAAGADQENPGVGPRLIASHVAEVEVQSNQESAVSNDPGPQELVRGP